MKVTTVEIKDVEIPSSMQHAMARQAEAERERRAKIIDAEGEFQAAAKLLEAADLISRNPVTIQLRYLQTLREIGNNENSTIVFPFPLDLIPSLVKAAGADDAVARPPGDPGPRADRGAAGAAGRSGRRERAAARGGGALSRPPTSGH